MSAAVLIGIGVVIGIALTSAWALWKLSSMFWPK